MKGERQMKRKHAVKKACLGMLAAVLTVSSSGASQAHSGRTDASGGHHDYRNVSGLGYYHYHHGYPAHLHTNGVCPYAVPVSVPEEPETESQKPAAEKIKISHKKLTLAQGKKKKIKITGTKSKVKWSTNKKKVATVNKYGKITAKSKGKAIIKASVNGKVYKCRVTVK